ncbi:MAG: Cna B-type domain-containing protein [Clostridia bacterium]|nr:Cna B-type domain-containing protein [Clostridia bacterium]
MTNQLKGTTTYTVDKLWAQLDDSGDVLTDGDGHTIYGKKAPANASVAMDLYRDDATPFTWIKGDKTQGTSHVTLDAADNFFYEYTDLPKYDEDGMKYTYVVNEASSTPSWYSGVAYDVIDENNKYFDCQLKNAPVGPGKSIWIRKEWLDDGDEPNRRPVQIALYRKAQGDETSDHYFGTYTLTSAQNWRAQLDISEYDADKNLLYGNLGNDQYYIREVGIGTGSSAEYDVYNSGAAYTESTGGAPDRVNGTSATIDRITGADSSYIYEAYYGVGEKGELQVTNRRIGTVNVKVDKTWLDGNNENNNRPSNVVLVLKTDGDDGYSDTSVTIQGTANTDDASKGVVTVNDVIGSPSDVDIKNDTGTSVASAQTLSTGDGKSYYFYNLPKYDAKGRILHYTVEEQNLAAPYQCQQVAQSYKATYVQDTQNIELANRRSATKVVTFNKLWQDEYNYSRGVRPDIFMTLYSATLNADGTTRTVKEVAPYPRRSWTRTNAYEWACIFDDNLPMYDENGAEILYFATEGCKVNMEAFDYMPVQFFNTKPTAGAESTSFAVLGTDGATYTLSKTAGTGEEDFQMIPENGWFLNRIGADVTISGRKVWQNVPSGWPATDFPELKITVNRIAQGVATSEMEKNIASMTELTRIAGTNNFGFTISKNAANEPLPKYNEQGRLYIYSVEEEVANATNLEATTYEKLPGEVNDFIITNVYDTSDEKNTGHLKVDKNWSGILAGDLAGKYRYPGVEFKLYRQYVSNDASKNTNTIHISDSDISVTAPELVETQILPAGNATSGSKTFTDSKLRIYAPTGKNYYYYIEETLLLGYSYTDTANNTKPQKSATFVLDAAATIAAPQSISFTNTYQPDVENISVTGSKVWDDNGNTYNTRPAMSDFAANNMKVYRYAPAQALEGGAPAIPEEEITVQTTNPENANYMTWSQSPSNANEWTYTISNLDRYAPSAVAWKYVIVESTVTGYTASDNGRVDSARGTVAAGGNITMPVLTNTNKKSLNVTKTWSGDDAYGLRPTQVIVELYAKIGTSGTWQKASVSFPTASDTGFKTLSAATSWGASYSELPAYVEDSGNIVPVSYQAVEVNIGGTVNPSGTIEGGYTVNFTATTDIAYTSNESPYTPSARLTLSTGNTADVTGITNTLEDNTNVSVRIRKQWINDSNDAYDTRSVTDATRATWKADFALFRKVEGGDWEQVKNTSDKYVILRVQAPNGQDGQNNSVMMEFGPFPKKNTAGTEYIYAAVEITPAGYEKDEVCNKLERGVTLNPTAVTADNSQIVAGTVTTASDDQFASVTSTTNSLTPTMTVRATKSWRTTDNNYYPAAGTQVTVELKKNGESFRTPLVKTFTFSGAITLVAVDFEGLAQYSYDTAGTAQPITYSLEEVVVNPDGTTTPTVPSGFFKRKDPAVDVAGTVGTDGYKEAVSIHNWLTRFKLSKLDSETNAEIIDAGVELTVSDASGAVFTWKHDTDGYALTKSSTDAKYNVLSIDSTTGNIEGLPIGTYTISETKTPSGYLTAGNRTFAIGDDGKISGTTNNVVAITDSRIRGHIKLEKGLTGSADGLEGVTFTLYRQTGATPVPANDTVITTAVVTNEDGEWTSQNNTATNASESGKTLADGLPSGTYYFVETLATADSTLMAGPAGTATIVTSGTTQPAVQTVPVTNSPFSASISLTKYDAADKTAIDKNVTFKLEKLSNNADGKTYPSGVTAFSTQTENIDEHGVVTFAGLTKGTYHIKETAATGYNITTPFEADIVIGEADNGQTITLNQETLGTSGRASNITGTYDENGITNPRSLGSVTLYKEDGVSHDALKGVEFKLLKKQASGGFGDWLKNLFTGNSYEYEEVPTENLTGTELDAAGQLTITGLDWGTYQLVETTAKDGYSTTDSATNDVLATVEFTINRTSTKDIELKVDEHNFYNYKTKLKIQKSGTDGATSLDGAEFTLTGKYVDAESHTVTGSLPVVVANGEITLEGVLIGGEQYTLHETQAPKGYELITTDLVFTMDTDGKVTAVSGNVTTGEGYVMTESTFFSNTITAVDTPIQIGIVKKDAEGKKTLQDAVFEVTPKEGSAFTNDAEKIVLNDSNMADGLNGKLIAGNTYILKETQAPKGYMLAADIEFTVDADGKATSSVTDTTDSNIEILTVLDSQIAISFLKRLVGDTTETGLAGAEFTLTPESGKTFAGGNTEIKFTSGTEAEAITGELIGGDTYTLTETKAPEGAMPVLAEHPELFSVTFTMGKDGVVKGLESDVAAYDEANRQMTFWNQPTGMMIFKRDMSAIGNTEDPLLANCTFEITGRFAADRYQAVEAKASRAAGEATITVTTTGQDDLNNALKGRLIVGETYRIKEVVPPNGFEMGIDVQFEVAGAKLNAKGEPALEISLIGETGDKGNNGYWVDYDGDGNPVITQRDEPIELKLKKTDMDGESLTGAIFSVTGVFAGGTEEETRSFGTNEQGEVTLSKVLIESGEGTDYIYKLQETTGPASYAPLEKPVYFKMVSQEDADGKRRTRAEILYDEGQTPEDYSKYLQVADDAENADMQDMSIANEKAKAALSLTKLDEDNQPITQWVEFTLTGTDYKEVKVVDGEGKVLFENLETGTYTLEETSAAGYDIAQKQGSGKEHESFKTTFTVKEADHNTVITLNGENLTTDRFTDTMGNTGEAGVINTRLRGSVILHKADGENQAAVNDAVFALMKKDEAAGTFTAVQENLKTQNGQLNISNIDWGTYKLVETQTAAGYGSTGRDAAGNPIATIESAEFTFNQFSDFSQPIELMSDGHAFYNYKTKLRIRKTGTTSDTGLQGAEFTVTGKFADGSTSMTVTTGADGTITMNGQLVGGEEYNLKETKAPAGYEVLTQNRVFKMGTDGKVSAVSGSVSSGAGYALTESGYFDNLIVVRDTQTAVTAGTDNNVKTGDASNNSLAYAVLLMAIAVLAVTGYKMRKKEEDF